MNDENTIRHDDAKYKVELLDLLRRIDFVFSQNNVRYYGVYGTCIGAMRNNGIIPWDEDIDIAVPREDFEKAIRVLNEDGSMFAGAFQSLPCFPGVFGRAFNRIDEKSRLERKRAYVDIYIIDKADDSKIMFLLRAFICAGLSRILAKRRGKCKNYHPVLYACYDFFFSPFRLFSSERIMKIRQKIYLSAKGDKYVRLTGGMTKVRHLASEFHSNIRVKFNDLTISIPVGFDTLLTRSYGDWRTPPPINKRDSHTFTGENGEWNVPLPGDESRLIKNI